MQRTIQLLLFAGVALAACGGQVLSNEGDGTSAHPIGAAEEDDSPVTPAAPAGETRSESASSIDAGPAKDANEACADLPIAEPPEGWTCTQIPGKATVAGRLVDTSCEPIVGARVELNLPLASECCTGSTVTDATGFFTLDIHVSSTPSSPIAFGSIPYDVTAHGRTVRFEGPPFCPSLVGTVVFPD